MDYKQKNRRHSQNRSNLLHSLDSVTSSMHL
uniref:Uncharacterized protein n=1 Tax=Anguilla anguilla TaxID=7936 RepID=A0A0E9V0I3_ANGAN